MATASTSARSAGVSRLPYPVSMFTAGTSPASRVRSSNDSSPFRSGAPSSPNGNSTAEIPTGTRPGRISVDGSTSATPPSLADPQNHHSTSAAGQRSPWSPT